MFSRVGTSVHRSPAPNSRSAVAAAAGSGARPRTPSGTAGAHGSTGAAFCNAPVATCNMSSQALIKSQSIKRCIVYTTNRPRLLMTIRHVGRANHERLPKVLDHQPHLANRTVSDRLRDSPVITSNLSEQLPGRLIGPAILRLD